MTASGAFVIVLGIALAASCALGAATAWAVVRWTKRPVLWVLAPVFALLWLAVGVTPMVFLAWAGSSAPPPRPPLPGPVQVAPAGEVKSP